MLVAALFDIFQKRAVARRSHHLSAEAIAGLTNVTEQGLPESGQPPARCYRCDRFEVVNDVFPPAESKRIENGMSKKKKSLHVASSYGCWRC
jgi:hypothetical protein